LVYEAEELARTENIEVSELFRLALRSYELAKIQALTALARPKGTEEQDMTMDEVCAYIKSTCAVKLAGCVVQRDEAGAY
jgi:hypothetical protein